MRPTLSAAAAALASLLLATSTSMAWDQDPAAMYLQRSDTITLSVGNARDVNTATHVIDPWPRNVGNRRIPGNGERMAGAAERYRDVNKLPLVPRPIFFPDSGGAGGGGGGAPGAGAGAAPK